MLEYALGMVETRGLVGSIEAADVMVKTANVRIVDTEYIKNGFVTIKVIGEVAAVKAAVDAATAAASRIGNVITSHVIPRPAEEIELIFRRLPPKGTTKPDKGSSAPRQSNPQAQSEDLFSSSESEAGYRAQLEAMTVHQLRTLARDIGGLSIAGRQISKANKEQLISELLQKRKEL